MNVDYRQFMLDVEASGADKLQSLLHHTQTMFGQLQSSHRRFVDPEAFVGSIKTYDDEGINIHNQMDVEEFFNLLADRLEGQLCSQEAVQSFRSFYGGQLVTQTKSKECEHLSEVMEPFSAIQCDIKGKKDLLESLDAYVDGEHMEGGTTIPFEAQGRKSRSSKLTIWQTTSTNARTVIGMLMQSGGMYPLSLYHHAHC